MNSCELIRQRLLEMEWTEVQRQSAAETFRHLENCPQCAAVAREYEQMQSVLLAGRDAVPDGGWKAMENRLAARTLPSVRRHRFPWVAIAASVLVGAMSYGVGRFAAKPAASEVIVDRGTPRATSAMVAFSPTDMAQDVKAFDEVSSVFDHRAAWLLVGDRTSDMGVSNQTIVQQHAVLLLQLTMLHSGTVISSADLAILPGQSAKLTVPANQGANLNYRISTSGELPTRLSISAQLTTPGGSEVLAALATTLNVEPGKRLSAGKMATSSGDYELQLAFGRADLTGGQAEIRSGQ